MSTTYYWPGETVRVRVTFATEDGEPIAVTGVQFRYRAPGASSPTLIDVGNVVEEDVGTYYTDIPLPTAGDWAIRATCATPSASAVEVGLTVMPSAVLA